MRSYPLNSSEAAVRFVLLTMLADGEASAAEFAALDSLNISARFELEPQQLSAICQALCEDLRIDVACDGQPLQIDDMILTSVLKEIDARTLQRDLIAIAQVVANADNYLDWNESRILDAARKQWGLWPSFEPELCEITVWRHDSSLKQSMA